MSIKRVLYVTDTHITHHNPKSRKDNYFAACVEEFKETLDLAVELKCDLWLHGGDMFDQAEPSGYCRNMILRILQDPKYQSFRKVGLIGNHDVRFNLAGIHNSALGTLFEAGALEHVNELPEYNIKCHDYRDALMEDIRGGLLLETDHMIHVVHGSIVLAPYYGDYVILDDIQVHPSCEYILAGHIHFPLEGEHPSGTKFINPGSIARNKLKLDIVDRIPQVLTLEYDSSVPKSMKIERWELESSRPGNEIFSTEFVEEQKAQEADTARYIQQISQVTLWTLGAGPDKFASLRESGRLKEIDDDVIDLAVQTLEEVTSHMTSRSE